MTVSEDKLDRGIILSVVLHVGIAVLIVASPVLFPFSTAAWGSSKAGGDGIKVNIVGNAVGMNLPSPEVVDPNAAANESKGLYQPPPEPAKPAPPPPPDPAAEKIPDAKAKVAKTPVTKAPKPAPTPAKTPTPTQTPSNAVPYGAAHPAIGYGTFQTGSGAVGAQAGEGNAFGVEYGPYVAAMQRRISQNWLQGMIDPSISHAPRVYVTFDILRDGTITNFQITQSSNIPSLDNSAKRAILASNPLQPLPPGFSGSKVNVSFYFEYVH